jgi:RNase H-like domain found in reverse transcriptase/Reverse transcriptase (RNA-dependent DNA polymerase)/Integrase zinc binding domain/Chromo (CHRromatin Organisation MOdifier) domain/Retroviral aspartyl protease
MSTPPLSTQNRFNVLTVEAIPQSDCESLTDTTLNDSEAVPTPLSPSLPRFRRRPHWERRLPSRYVVASNPSPNSLELKVSLQTLDTGDVFSTTALLDSGATSQFMHSDFVKRNRLATKALSRPIPIYNVDGSSNEAGSISEVVEVMLRYGDHSERATFAVTGLGKQEVILGLTWLREHNPEVDWQSGEVKMSRCPTHCRTCQSEVNAERKVRLIESANIRSCRAGPLPDVDIGMEGIPELCVDHDDEEDDEPYEEDDLLEEGDRLFTTNIPSEAEFIRASSNISQRLAEAFHKHTQPKTFHESVPTFLHDYEDIFAKSSFDRLPNRKVWDHAIELLPGSKPSNCKVYPLAPSEQVELDAFIQENLATGRIRPSKSPMASPVFFIKKKDGTLRLVQDYRALNSVTVKNRYPLPLISELVNQLRGARFFTKLDVRWGYQNVRMKEGDEWKAAFRTNRGLYEPLVMFFGLTNSPSTFQTMMNDIFQDLIMEGVVCVYLDDILIFTKSIEEHRRITRLVLERLREHKLFLRHDKCEFEQTTIEYLGLIISEGEVRMDPVKVAGVTEWPIPATKKEVQSFLGFANFYRRFIEGFSHHARPLFELTKKDQKWSWGEDEQRAFDEIKTRVTSSPILRFADDSKAFRVEADSSDFATGAVLSQQSVDDLRWHPIAYYSKSLNAVERNYDIHDKEMLAVMRALEEWRHFLEGAQHQVEVWTDHKNLEYFMTAKKLNRRQARWSLYLSRFDFVMHHRPGSSMGKCDALSRRVDHNPEGDDNRDIVLLRPEFFAARALEGITVEGAERGILREIRKGLKDGKGEDAVIVAMKGLDEAKGTTLRSSEWSKDDGLWRFRDRIYVPMIADLRRRIMEQHHDSVIGGHAGRWKTLELLMRSYWWPNMSRYVGQYCKTCDLCLRTKTQKQRPYGELLALPIPEHPWDVTSVDFIVELPDSHGFDAVMVVVDSVTKRGHFIPTHTTVTALGSARLYLQHVWKLHGLPKSMVSDRGPQFVAEFMRELYRLLGIQVSASTAYHPQSDGQTERVNQELEQYIRVFVNERQNDWDTLLPLAEFAYNNHTHSATQHTPFFVDTGRHPRMGFEPNQPPSKVEAVNVFAERMKSTLEESRAALAKSKDDMARYYNQRRTPAPKFEVGDKVFLDATDITTTRPSKKFAHRFLGPYSVMRPVGSHAYRLRLPPSMSRIHPVFHVVKLRPAPIDPIPGRRVRAPPAPEIVGGEKRYEVEEVLDSRMRYRRLQYLVRWKGYGYEENSWLDERDLDAPALLADFYKSHPTAPKRISMLDFGQMGFRPCSQ